MACSRILKNKDPAIYKTNLPSASSSVLMFNFYYILWRLSTTNSTGCTKMFNTREVETGWFSLSAQREHGSAADPAAVRGATRSPMSAQRERL
jgi:hypothetical protein